MDRREVCDILARLSGLDPESIDDTLMLETDLGLDSLAMIELTVALGDRAPAGIVAAMEDIVEVSDLLAYLQVDPDAR